MKSVNFRAEQQNLPSVNNRKKIKWENKTEHRDLWEYHERGIPLGSQKKKDKIKQNCSNKQWLKTCVI